MAWLALALVYRDLLWGMSSSQSLSSSAGFSNRNTSGNALDRKLVWNSSSTGVPSKYLELYSSISFLFTCTKRDLGFFSISARNRTAPKKKKKKTLRRRIERPYSPHILDTDWIFHLRTLSTETTCLCCPLASACSFWRCFWTHGNALETAWYDRFATQESEIKTGWVVSWRLSKHLAMLHKRFDLLTGHWTHLMHSAQVCSNLFPHLFVFAQVVSEKQGNCQEKNLAQVWEWETNWS